MTQENKQTKPNQLNIQGTRRKKIFSVMSSFLRHSFSSAPSRRPALPPGAGGREVLPVFLRALGLDFGTPCPRSVYQYCRQAEQHFLLPSLYPLGCWGKASAVFPHNSSMSDTENCCSNTSIPILTAFPASFHCYSREFTEATESAKIATFLGTVGKGQDCPEISR